MSTTTDRSKGTRDAVFIFLSQTCFSSQSRGEGQVHLYIRNRVNAIAMPKRRKKRDPSQTSNPPHSGLGPATSSPSKPCMGSSPRTSTCACSAASLSSSLTAFSANHDSYERSQYQYDSSGTCGDVLVPKAPSCYRDLRRHSLVPLRLKL